MNRRKGLGRPTKKERRDLDNFFDDDDDFDWEIEMEEGKLIE